MSNIFFVVDFNLPLRTAAATIATKPGVICDIFKNIYLFGCIVLSCGMQDL